MKLPENLRYTKDHEWVRLDEDGTAFVGITDFAQGELGDIVFVELDGEGTELGEGDVFGTVEAVKTVSELYMPLAGTIKAVNADLESAPEAVNDDPYGEGWMIQIDPAEAGDLDDLMSAEDYADMVAA